MITFQVSGLTGMRMRIGRLAHFDAHRLLGQLGKLIQAQTMRHFEGESGPLGAWAGLADSTWARKSGNQILTETGRLRGSIHAVLGQRQVEVGTNVHYGKYHQRGTRRMVARPFLGFSDADRDEVRRAVENFMHRLIV